MNSRNNHLIFDLTNSNFHVVKSFILTLIVFIGGAFLIGSCESLLEDFKEDEIAIEERDPRFVQCYYEEDLAKNKCDSVLTSIFGEKLFSQNVKFDLSESSLNCEVDGSIQLVTFGDSNYCVPNSYDLRYSVKSRGNIIFPFRMVAGNDMEFEPVSTIIKDQLVGYRRLLEGDFKIGYPQAKSIAASKGVDFNESALELVKNEGDSLASQNSYHWEAELESDQNSVVLLLIDVMTGATSTELLTITYITDSILN